MKKVELLWFGGCPNHLAAREMIEDALALLQLEATVTSIEVLDLATAERVRFPGSPTIRVDGTDIEPDFQPCDDCAPRCRVYLTANGLKSLPARAWLQAALGDSPVGSLA